MEAMPMKTSFRPLALDANMLELRRKLQKALKAMDKLSQDYRKALDEAEPWVASVSNIAEQVSCCTRASPDNSLEKQFPGIREALLRRLQTSTEASFAKITSSMKAMDAIRQDARKVAEASMKYYKQRASNLPVQEVAKATATWPSASDILQWLLSISDLMNEDLLYREHLLASLPVSTTDEHENLAVKWLQPTKLQAYVQDVFSYCHYFLEASF